MTRDGWRWPLSACAVGALVGVVLTLQAGPARAGGSLVTWEKGAYAPGETVRGTSTFSRGCCDRGLPSDGPYFVYMWHAAEGEIPPLPPSAIRVGQVEITGRSPGWTATYEFTVPQVPPGEYEIFDCNDPCTKMLGDLVESQLAVANDPEIRQWSRMRWLERRIFGQAGALRGALHRATKDLKRSDNVLEMRLTEIEERLAALEVSATRSDATGKRIAEGGLVGAGVVALLVALHLLTRGSS